LRIFQLTESLRPQNLETLIPEKEFTNQKKFPDTGPKRDTGVLSKPIQTLLAAYADNLVASASLVEERVPVMDRPAMESRLRDSLFFFLHKKGGGLFGNSPGRL